MRIKDIFDNKGRTHDEFTIITTTKSQLPNHIGQGIYVSLSMSWAPDRPKGISKWGYAIPGDHLGENVKFDDLPFHIKEHIKNKLMFGKLRKDSA